MIIILIFFKLELFNIFFKKWKKKYLINKIVFYYCKKNIGGVKWYLKYYDII